MAYNNKYLCHYTTLDVLCKLFSALNPKTHPDFAFHASSIHFMNDSSEYGARFKFIKNDIQDAIYNYRGEPYVISFSELEDNIPMWRMYGDSGHGICLCFSKEKLLKNFSGRLKVCHYVNLRSLADYTLADTDEIDIHSINYQDSQAYKSAYIKDSCFANEKEWRIVELNSWAPSQQKK